jgi:hypothetical protein
MVDMMGWPIPRPKSEIDNYKPEYLTVKQVQEKCFDIISHLESLPLGHAMYVLESAKELLMDCHVVDSQGLQYQHRQRELSQPDRGKRNS